MSITVKIHGMSGSTCTRRVAATCKELGIKYELVTVALNKGEHKTPEYLKKQPFGQVPILEDDGFFVFESRAIARYLAVKYGGIGSLIPAQTDVKATGLFEQAASIEYSAFDPAASGLTFERVFAKAKGLEGNEVIAEKHIQTLRAKMEGYEAILSKQKYLTGDHFTLADLFHLPYGTMITDVVGIDVLNSKPNVARWWADISSRESWQAVKNGA